MRLTVPEPTLKYHVAVKPLETDYLILVEFIILEYSCQLVPILIDESA
jgi:hypothetical protein